MSQLSNWLTMGGYSIYVWPAYGLVCMVFLMNIFGIRKQRQNTRKLLRQWYNHREPSQENN